MTNNEPDYNDNLYFEKKMDCKNCPYTDEYCASGDCERNADVSKTLTEQWKKGELPYGRYYVELAYNGNNIIMAEYWWDKTLTLDDHEYSREEVKRILAPVPTFDEWKASYNCMLENEVLRLKNTRLEELLRECKIYVENFIEGSTLINEHHISYISLQRIKEVLK